jgi:hypothetical protein
MTDIGDYEPEDAWDAGDPVELQALNIRRRLALLIDTDDRTAPRAVLRGDDLAVDIDYALDRAAGLPDLEHELMIFAAIVALVRA